MLPPRGKNVFRNCSRMVACLRRRPQLRQRCRALRAQGVRVSVRGWLLAIEGGSGTNVIPPQRIAPRRIFVNKGRRISQISTPRPLTFPPSLAT
jgi:hypothetical protein